MKILISACLLGTSCRYDGKSKPCQGAIDLLKSKNIELIPICPEVDGGLPTPRDPSERSGNQVITCNGRNVTRQYRLGAEHALKAAQETGCTVAILKERSPSCGSHGIYDGTFSKKLIPGQGVTAELLINSGIKVYGESEIERIFTDDSKDIPTV